MSFEFEICLAERKLVKIQPDSALVAKELTEAEADLLSARNSFSVGGWKWATVQAYYSMFHTAKALVLAKGYREKSHKCLLFALRYLYSDKNILELHFISEFEETMGARTDADYGLAYSKTSASVSIKNAENFLKRAKELLGSAKL